MDDKESMSNISEVLSCPFCRPGKRKKWETWDGIRRSETFLVATSLISYDQRGLIHMED